MAVSSALLPHVPVPRVIRDGERFTLLWDDPASIGPMRGFYGAGGELWGNARSC